MSQSLFFSSRRFRPRKLSRDASAFMLKDTLFLNGLGPFHYRHPAALVSCLYNKSHSSPVASQPSLSHSHYIHARELSVVCASSLTHCSLHGAAALVLRSEELLVGDVARAAARHVPRLHSMAVLARPVRDGPRAHQLRHEAPAAAATAAAVAAGSAGC